MRIAVPREGKDQPLVAATPDTVKKLISLGYDVTVQEGAGAQASLPDSAYEQMGATLTSDEADVWAADIVISLDAPTPEHLALTRPGTTLVSRMAPGRNPDLVKNLQDAGVTALAMDAVPRLSRAQAMDVLSSQANVAGYRAVIEAAAHFGRLFTGQVTAAGKMPPAKVYVIGAGVAGLAAIGTANSMGAEVFATDVRPEVAEQVESMGASFVAIPTAQEVSTDGYAKEMNADQAALANALYADRAAFCDIVITTAAIPGRAAPILLDDEAVAAMKPGSIIVDMAAGTGGNCTLTRPGEVWTTDGGVTIIGHTDLAKRLPGQSSQLYGQNIVNLFKLLTPGKDGRMVLDLDDEILRGICVTKDGALFWPPPPVKVSAAPTSRVPPAETPEMRAARAAAKAEEEARKKRKLFAWGALAAVIAAALVMVTPAAAAPSYVVLVLAIVVGFHVITNVTHSLHTPLMSVTNAISGIILVGAILQVGSENLFVTILSFVAIVVAAINIFGGFTVTHRMLSMFRRD
ncbi:Re/Si-specific NAD(P)(+) transhydrogenase subunit alpha [Schaalia sp. 19OD2882]|uniref:Re/Si-specific NAD(P)(+) transhydrogenase subunit alpha n=1 Tax=Schaalia sp. 19OD2882 TaxID=2794089 RepID=UPI001C1EC2E0|nr:Re/Si-specific NAD(P)(+) transhydrogenase subunit alpha [Schaalia sp. 19OD2882]QWW19513.1 Re/Si-specific NAD(P)(+) transhydrogenase subunit alpha [Schaalia sp. 19OD2882]